LAIEEEKPSGRKARPQGVDPSCAGVAGQILQSGCNESRHLGDMTDLLTIGACLTVGIVSRVDTAWTTWSIRPNGSPN
jgi:hypothetical protein